jgi:two-component system, OmpR family, response regulator CpxR
MKLLLVDDDAESCSMLQGFLRESGYAVDLEPDGAFVQARVETGAYDLLILDVMLQGICGFELLRAIRKTSHVPILILTARTSRSDRVRGFEMGADDYLLKPFFPEELLARVRAILRRVRTPPVNPPPALEFEDLRLEPGNRDAQFEGKPLGLTAMECAILEHLMRCRGRVVSRDSLSLNLYNRLASPFDRSIDTHISRIRRKLGERGDLILGIRGAGYQLRLH